MYNLIDYSSNYSETIGSLWFYSKDEANNVNNDIPNTNNFRSFKFKAKLLENTSCSACAKCSEWNFKNCSNCCAIKIFK